MQALEPGAQIRTKAVKAHFQGTNGNFLELDFRVPPKSQTPKKKPVYFNFLYMGADYGQQEAGSLTPDHFLTAHGWGMVDEVIEALLALPDADKVLKKKFAERKEDLIEQVVNALHAKHLPKGADDGEDQR
jgi:hypothetical protein